MRVTLHKLCYPFTMINIRNLLSLKYQNKVTDYLKIVSQFLPTSMIRMLETRKENLYVGLVLKGTASMTYHLLAPF